MAKTEIIIAFGKLKNLVKKVKNVNEAIEILKTIEELKEIFTLRKEMFEKKDKWHKIHDIAAAQDKGDDPLISPIDAATQLGLTRQTIYNKIKKGDIRSVKTGTGLKDAVKIPQSEIDRIKKGNS